MKATGNKRKKVSHMNGLIADRNPSGESIQRLFEAHCRKTPDAPALVAGEDRLTYRELNVRANRLAHYLRSLGVGPDALVGLCVERSADMAVGILAVLKGGGAYVPLDPAYPRDRIEYMLTDSGTSILVTEKKFADGFGDHRGVIVTLDGDAEKIERESDRDPAPSLGPDSLAYVIYTSGSTGKPKGVMITHGNLVNYVRTLPNALGLADSDGYLHTASISFSSSVRQLLVPLSIGASVVVATLDQMRDPLSLFELIRQEAVTVVDLVPSFWRSCLLALNSTSKENEDRLLDNKLRVLLSASEPLPVSTPRELASKFGSGVRLINMYGQTETSGIIAVAPIDAASLGESGIVSIGRGIENARIYIVDDQMQMVPDGEQGELCVGGPGVGRGYLNRPELTADRFTADPFVDGGRLYRTGDLARFRPSGELEYLGRIDNQVKIRGFRVELGEIESVIGLFRDVAEAVVAARGTSSGNSRLAAYVVTRNGSKMDVAELRNYLRTQLPDYMVPASFVELSQLPLTPNGKVDRQALPDPAMSASADRSDYAAPQTETEKALVKIWSEVLGLSNVGVDDSFFDLGGNSLLAISMFASIERSFKKNIPIATLFGAGTVRKLAEIVDQEGWSAPESSIVPIRPTGTTPPFFCVHAGGGNVLFYHDLAKHLPEDVVFYGIRAMRLGGRQVGHGTLEEMAEFYISEIQAVQPKGPYFIGGHSLGGMIALEVAQQLGKLGQEVAILAMFDTWGPGYPKLLPNVSSVRGKLYELGHRAQKHVDQIRELDFRKKLGYFANIAIKLDARFKRQFKYGYKKVVRKVYKQLEKPIPQDYIQIEDQIHKAARKYSPKEFPGKVTFFRADFQPEGVFPDPLLGWGGMFRDGMEIHDVPGDHITIMKDPNVSILAAAFDGCIRAAFDSHAAGIADAEPAIASRRRKVRPRRAVKARLG